MTLKISSSTSSDGAEDKRRFILEGRLEGQSVSELQRVWEAAVRSGRAPVEVDLNGLIYTSESGAQLLRDMRMKGAALTAGSPLAKSWIEDQVKDTTRRFVS